MGREVPGSLASCNTRKLKCILINHMASENENYTLKNDNDNDSDHYHVIVLLREIILISKISTMHI